MVEVFFVILNVLGSIGYPFRFWFGSGNTHNPKYQKTGSIRYLCRVRISSDSFLSDRVRFGFSGLVYLPSPTSPINIQSTPSACMKIDLMLPQLFFFNFIVLNVSFSLNVSEKRPKRCLNLNETAALSLLVFGGFSRVLFHVFLVVFILEFVVVNRSRPWDY